MRMRMRMKKKHCAPCVHCVWLAFCLYKISCGLSSILIEFILSSLSHHSHPFTNTARTEFVGSVWRSVFTLTTNIHTEKIRLTSNSFKVLYMPNAFFYRFSK